MKWICPECSASHTVTERHIGKNVKCPKCGASSIVEIDSAEGDTPPAIMNAMASFTEEDSETAKPVARATKSPEYAPLPPMTSIVKYLLTGLWILSIIAILIAFNDENLFPLRWFFGFSFAGLVVQTIMLLPFYNACDDIHAIRKHLEKSA